MANYYVTKNTSGGWSAKKVGASRASSNHPTQKAAEKAAKQYSSNTGGGEVRIHSVRGPIRDSDTVAPGNDPMPPRDRKN